MTAAEDKRIYGGLVDDNRDKSQPEEQDKPEFGNYDSQPAYPEESSLADQSSEDLEEKGVDFFQDIIAESPPDETLESVSPESIPPEPIPPEPISPEPEPPEDAEITLPGVDTQSALDMPVSLEEGVESHPEVTFLESAAGSSLGKHIWGLDVGTHSIKLVGITRGFRKTNLTHLSVVEISPQKELSREPNTKDIRVNGLLLAIEKIGLERNSMITAVGSTAVVVRQIQYPLTARQKLLSALRWETRRYIPFKPDEVVVDAQILNENTQAGKMEVLLTAVTKEHLNEHMGVLEQAGIKPLLVDAGPLAVFNAVMSREELKPQETIVLLDMGASVTTLSIYGLNGTFFTLALSVGGYRITREVQARCQIGYREAEDLKCRGERSADHYTDDKLYYPLHEALQNTYEMLVNEIRQALIYYNKQTGINKFDKLILAGGGASLVELPEYLGRKLGVPVHVFNPLEAFEVDPKKFNVNAVHKLSPQFTLAVGLALRGDIL